MSTDFPSHLVSHSSSQSRSSLPLHCICINQPWNTLLQLLTICPKFLHPIHFIFGVIPPFPTPLTLSFPINEGVTWLKSSSAEYFNKQYGRLHIHMRCTHVQCVNLIHHYKCLILNQNKEDHKYCLCLPLHKLFSYVITIFPIHDTPHDSHELLRKWSHKHS